jgi:hypothetical protein
MRAHSHEPGRPDGEDFASRAHPEAVVLELGDDIGALIVHADACMHGLEIEISAYGETPRGEHRQVLERGAAGRATFSAVFDRLPAGCYTLWLDGVPRARGVAVAGGAVAELDWTGAERPPAAVPQR